MKFYLFKTLKTHYSIYHETICDKGVATGHRFAMKGHRTNRLGTTATDPLWVEKIPLLHQIIRTFKIVFVRNLIL